MEHEISYTVVVKRAGNALLLLTLLFYFSLQVTLFLCIGEYSNTCSFCRLVTSIMCAISGRSYCMITLALGIEPAQFSLKLALL